MPTAIAVTRTGRRTAKQTQRTTDLRVQEPQCVYLVYMSARSFPTARSAARHAFCRVRSERVLRAQFRSAHDRSVWVASSSEALAALTKDVHEAKRDRRLLVLDEVEDVTQHLYSAYFRYVVTASDRLRLLPFDELAEVLTSPDKAERFIGGAYDAVGEAVLLYRGNVEPLVVPITWFRNSSSRARVDAHALCIVDYGQTIRLGKFEASADAILYEFDADYRRTARKRALAEDASLGASIRRLRLQRGLSREDFPGITAKALARVERNEVRTPRARTCAIIAKTLGVHVDALGSY